MQVIRESFLLAGDSGWMLIALPVEEAVMAGVFIPCLISSVGQPRRLGDPLVDEYLRFTAARVRSNSLVAQSLGLPRQQVTVEVSGREAHGFMMASYSMGVNRPSRACRRRR